MLTHGARTGRSPFKDTAFWWLFITAAIATTAVATTAASINPCSHCRYYAIAPFTLVLPLPPLPSPTGFVATFFVATGFSFAVISAVAFAA